MVVTGVLKKRKAGKWEEQVDCKGNLVHSGFLWGAGKIILGIKNVL